MITLGVLLLAWTALSWLVQANAVGPVLCVVS